MNVLIAIVVALILFSIILAIYIKSYRSPQLFGEAIFRVATEEKVVALTFDDGPSPLYTPQILEILKAQGIKATFFVLGSEAEEHPDIVKKIIAEGHEVGNHSWTHEQLVFSTPAYIRGQIDKTDALLRQLGCQGDIPFRAPYGRKLVALPWVLLRSHRKHILFDVIPYDWERPGPEEIIRRAIADTRPGSIILLHDGRGERSQTVEATKGIIETLKSQGYRFVTIRSLCYEKQNGA